MSPLNAFIFLQVHSGQLLYQIWHHPFPSQHRITTKRPPSQVASVSRSSTVRHKQVLILHWSPQMKWDVASWRWDDWCFSWLFFCGPQPYGLKGRKVHWTQVHIFKERSFMLRFMQSVAFLSLFLSFLYIIIIIPFVIVEWRKPWVLSCDSVES